MNILEQKIIGIISQIYADVQIDCPPDLFEEIMMQSVLDRLSEDEARQVDQQFIIDQL